MLGPKAVLAGASTSTASLAAVLPRLLRVPIRRVVLTAMPTSSDPGFTHGRGSASRLVDPPPQERDDQNVDGQPGQNGHHDDVEDD